MQLSVALTIKADYVLFFVYFKGEGVCTLFSVSSNCSSPFFPFQFRSWMQPSSVSQEAKMVNKVWSSGVKVVSREQHLACETLLFVVINSLAVFLFVFLNKVCFLKETNLRKKGLLTKTWRLLI